MVGGLRTCPASWLTAILVLSITQYQTYKENTMSATLLVPIVLFVGGILLAIAITNVALRRLAK